MRSLAVVLEALDLRVRSRDEVALCPAWSRRRLVVGQVLLPLRIRFASDAGHLELVMAQEWPRVDHPVLAVVYGYQQQIDTPDSLRQNTTRIAQRIGGDIGMDIGHQCIPLAGVVWSLVEELRIPAVVQGEAAAALDLDH